ncbi:MAG: DNA repair protein RecN, partial [Candidatus Omnitrophica bacterium]|nr:DNA repair protein RecN [Candidatus Omnitrophota bacterium]
MLSQLTIHNFGLIDKVVIEFSRKLNILTGSTGAGKSIVIDGLRFALGERLSASQIRDKSRPCVIEAVFDLNTSPLRHSDLFKDFLDADDNSLIINRQLSADGRKKIKVNGFTVTLAQLKALGNHLIDFHGPHDHQMLLSEELHINFLDPLVDFGDLKETYSRLYNDYIRLRSQLRDLENASSSRERDLDLLGHQIKELSQASLKAEDYEALRADQTRVANAEKLHENGAALLRLFENRDIGITDSIHKAFSSVRTLQHTDTATETLAEYLTNIQENSDQLIMELRDYLDSLSFEPRQAREINDKYDIYENIKRKYGPTIEEAHDFYLKAQEKYDLLINLEHNDARLKKDIAACEKKLTKLARQLTEAREKGALALKETIEQELKDLGIKQVLFEARVTSVDFHAEGRDKVVFYISPNTGEDLKPLAEIVSSGEAARVMLALKKALTRVDPIPVLIFDEIDAQIGGRLGKVIGTKLKSLSNDRQIILITHLPQIASFADTHFK